MNNHRLMIFNGVDLSISGAQHFFVVTKFSFFAIHYLLQPTLFIPYFTFFKFLLKITLKLRKETMKDRIFYFSTICQICFVMTLLFSCSKNNPNSVANNENERIVKTAGAKSTFEIATWNIEHFPKQGAATITAFATMVKNLDIDLIALQEIESESALKKITDEADQWKYLINAYPSQYDNYQRTAILYKHEFISVSSAQYILDEHEYHFAYRPPLAAYVEVYDVNADIRFNFTIIVLHLKAFGDETSINRRKESIRQLEKWISDEISAGSDPDFVVLGDWNDQLEDEQSTNVFLPFLDKTDLYRFLTQSLVSDYTYLGSYQNVIDHIMITTDSDNEYGVDGEIEILKLEEQYHSYVEKISDHRPVMAVFKGKKLSN
jgi:endonuclease/exonuclease/phosphatase family metal-dependent hydrolase